jgi:hypothetical protein
MTRRADDDSRALTRRRLLGGVAVAVTGGSAGCLGGPTDEMDGTPTTETGRTRATETGRAAREEPPTRQPSDGGASAAQPQIASVSVSDFIQYALAGVHPHVHNRANVQYVVVGVDPSSTAVKPRAVRERLGLSLDDTTMERATEQPFPWQRQMVDVAFAVPKDETFDAGTVRFAGQKIEPLPAATIDRLNNPPVFAVSDLTVAPSEIDAGERTTATMRFTLSNTGDGQGTFGVSLQGNYASGSATVTATLDAGAEREVTGETEIIGRGDAVTVTVDWGVRARQFTIPIVGSTPTATVKTGTGTATPN